MVREDSDGSLRAHGTSLLRHCSRQHRSNITDYEFMIHDHRWRKRSLSLSLSAPLWRRVHTADQRGIYLSGGPFCCSSQNRKCATQQFLPCLQVRTFSRVSPISSSPLPFNAPSALRFAHLVTYGNPPPRINTSYDISPPFSWDPTQQFRVRAWDCETEEWCVRGAESS